MLFRSTGVAALKLGRHFVGYEQNKTYALLAASRLSEMAGEDLPESISTTSALVSRKRQQSLFAKA